MCSRDRTRTYNLPVNRRSIAPESTAPEMGNQPSSSILRPLETLLRSF